MHNKNLNILSSMVLVTSALLGLAGCSSMPSKSIQEVGTAALTMDDVAADYHVGRKRQETARSFEAWGKMSEGIRKELEDSASLDEAGPVSPAEFGNPKEVLDHMPITSKVEVKETGEDE